MGPAQKVTAGIERGVGGEACCAQGTVFGTVKSIKRTGGKENLATRWDLEEKGNIVIEGLDWVLGTQLPCEKNVEWGGSEQKCYYRKNAKEGKKQTSG